MLCTETLHLRLWVNLLSSTGFTVAEDGVDRLTIHHGLVMESELPYFRCYYLTAENRFSGIPAEFSACNRGDAVATAADLYAKRTDTERHGVEIWDGPERVFAGDPRAVKTNMARDVSTTESLRKRR
jgi:hypothetical protein